MKTTTEAITPEIAKTYLELNKNIRPISLPDVKKYSDDMIHGNWRLSTQSIAFDIPGNLVDGQTRLSAVISSGKTIQCKVDRELTEDEVAVIDLGRKRASNLVISVSDKRISEPIVWIARLAFGSHPSTRQLKEIKDLFLTEAEMLVNQCGTCKAGLSRAPIKAAFILSMKKDGVSCLFYKMLLSVESSMISDVSKLNEMPTSIRSLYSRLMKRKINEGNQMFVETCDAIKNPNKTRIWDRDIPTELAAARKYIHKLLIQ